MSASQPSAEPAEASEQIRMAYKTGYDEGYSDASDGMVDHDACEEGWQQYSAAFASPPPAQAAVAPSEPHREEFLREFIRDAEVARSEMMSWPAELQAEAAKTGVLEFPRRARHPETSAGNALREIIKPETATSNSSIVPPVASEPPKLPEPSVEMLRASEGIRLLIENAAYPREDIDIDAVHALCMCIARAAREAYGRSLPSETKS